MSFPPADPLSLTAWLVDGALAALLIAAIVYLWQMNRRLAELRRAQTSLPDLLASAAGDIDRAEKGLREMHGRAATVIDKLSRHSVSAEKVEGELRDALQMADLLSKRLDDRIEAAQALSRSTAAASEPEPEAISIDTGSQDATEPDPVGESASLSPAIQELLDTAKTFEANR